MNIRALLILLVLLASAPPAFILGSNLLERKQQDIAAARQQVVAIAQLAAGELAQTLEGAKQLVVGLSRSEAVVGGDGPGCAAVLADVLKRFPQYTTVAAMHPDGELYCEGRGSGRRLNVADREYFQRALQADSPVVGEPVVGRITGSPVLSVALAVRDAAGRPRAVLVAALDLRAFGQVFVRAHTQPDLGFSLWGARGTLVAHYPDVELFAGKVFPDSPIARFAATGQDGTSGEIPGLDGITRVYGLARPPVEGSGLRVTVGLPRASVVAEAERAFRHTLLGIGAVALLALVAAWLTGEAFVRRHLLRLVRAAARLGAGDLSVRIGAPYPGGELGQLQAAFDRTAESLQAQHGQLESAAGALLRTNRALTLLSAGNQALLHAREENALLARVCRVAVEQGGYRMAWVGLTGREAQPTLLPVAHSGFEDGYLALLQAAPDTYPSAAAARTRETIVIQDVDQDPRYAPWRPDALARNYRAAIALPLLTNGEALGTLTLYASEPHAFGETELPLLKEMADDLAFGIATLRLHTRQQQAEEEIRRLNADLERRIAERTAQLEATSREIEDLYNNAPCGYHSLDREGRFVRVNDTELAWLGYTREEMIGRMSVLDILTSESRRIFARNFPRFKETGELRDVEFELVRKDGTVLPVSLSATAVRDETGQFLASRTTLFDITERRQAQVELQAANAYEVTHGRALALFNSTFNREQLLRDLLALLAENHPFPVAACYGYDEWSGSIRCEATLGTADSLAREFPMGEGLIGEAARSNRCIVLDTADRDSGLAVDAGVVAFMPAGVVVCPVTYQEKRLAVLVLAASRAVSARDLAFLERLTVQLGIALHNLRQYADMRLLAEELRVRSEEIARKNAQLEDANRLKSEFLANMSHELRTPLNAIIGFSEALRDGLAGELQPRQREFIGDIYDSGQHLLALINDILDLSKIEAGQMTLDLAPVDIAGTLAGSLSIVKEKAASQRVRVELEVAPGVELACVDGRKFKQIVYNLLANAVKFTPEGGKMVLRTRRLAGGHDALKRAVAALPYLHRHVPVAAPAWDGDWLELTVADTGIGIAQADMTRLFQPFIQIDSSLARKYAGTGLGLAMVRRLAELHGGVPAVASEPGMGSVFAVWLPYRPADEAALRPAPQAAETVARTAGTRRALVVEDDARAADWLRRELESEGFEVSRAGNAETGLLLAQQEMPDLVVLDVFLPGMDGWELLARLKAEAALAYIPVVIVSVAADQHQGYALGAAEVLQKPLQRDELLAVLAKLGFRPRPGQPYAVLVADDDPKAVEIISTFLENAGHHVLRAYGGRDAIESARRSHPDLVVLDLMMPDVSGFEVVEALKSMPDTHEIPIVVLTAKVLMAEDRLRLNGHVLDILEKSTFDGAQFVREVRRAMGRRPLAAAGA